MSNEYERQKLREELRIHTEAFLRKGGQIQQCPIQYSERERKWLKIKEEA